MSVPREQKFSKAKPCPACGHSNWCYETKSGRSFWCGRVDVYAGRRGEPLKMGWKHFYEAATGKTEQHVEPRPRPRQTRDPEPIDPAAFADAAERGRKAITNDQVRALADLLGVNRTSLRREHVGWLDASNGVWRDPDTGREVVRRLLSGTNTPCRGPGAFTFPTYDDRWRVTGVRLRGTPDAENPTGGKFCMSQMDGNGLVIPRGLERGGDLYCPEGASSLAALLTLRLSGVARPSCSGGVDYLRGVVAFLRPSRVFVFGDRGDKPDLLGRRAGEHWAPIVADRLCGAWPGLQLVMSIIPPAGVKDARQWLLQGGTRAEIQNYVERACAKGLRHAG